MKKVKNKKIIILSIIIILVILLTILFMFLFRKTDVKKLKGTVTEMPVNAAFTDIGFYSCVLNSYNKENGTNYTRDYNLSDEQLASIKNVSCVNTTFPSFLNNGIYMETPPEDEFFIEKRYSYKSANVMAYYSDYVMETYLDMIINTDGINNVDGIEKLSSLESISIRLKNENTGTYDFNNPNLKIINLQGDYFNGTVDLSGAVNLKTFDYDSIPESGNTNSNKNMPNIIGLNNLTSLVSLKLDGYSSEIVKDLTITNIEELYLINTDLSDLSLLSKFTNLKKLAINKADGNNSVSSTKLSELSYLTNLTFLAWNGKVSETGELPLMPNLITLNLNGFEDLNSVDFTKFPNITTLKLNSAKIIGDSNLLDVFSSDEINALKKLEQLEINNTAISDITGIELFSNLKTLVLDRNISKNEYSNKVNIQNVASNLEVLYGEVDDYGKLPNLKENYIYDSLQSGHVYGSNINSLKNLEVVVANDDFINQLVDLSKIKYLIGGVSYSHLKEMKNLEYFSGGLIDISSSEVSFINNSKLKHLIFLPCGDICLFGTNNNLTLTDLPEGIESIYLPIYDSHYRIDTSTIRDISELTNLKFYVGGLSEETYDLTSNKNLEFMIVDILNNVKKIDFGESNLKYFSIQDVKNSMYDIPNINFSKCNKLLDFNIEGYSPNSDIVTFGFKNDDYSNHLPIKLPPQYKLIDVQSEKNLVSMDENGILKINEVGNDKITVIYKNMLPTASSNNSLTLSNELYAFDLIFKDDRYIKNSDYLFTATDRSEKKIISNIKQKGAFLSAAVDNKQLKIMHSQFSNEPLRTYKLINIHSNDYDITDDTIFYNGDFDVNKVYVSNAGFNVVDDKLDIIYNNDVIKSYNLVKKNNILGDVNGDGIVSISDMSLQYKHVKYILDLIGDQNYRADLNNDDDVSITDVTQLYKFIKGIINSF